MKKALKLVVACAVLAHSMALDCSAIGVYSPTSAGFVLSTQNLQAAGTTTINGAVTIEWSDGSGVVVGRQTVNSVGMMTPYMWSCDFNLPSTVGVAPNTVTVNFWLKTSVNNIKGRCRMTAGGIDQTTPPIT